MLGVLLNVRTVERTDNTHQCHDVAEHHAQTIHTTEYQRPIEELECAVGAKLHAQHGEKHQDRHADQVALLDAGRYEGQQHAAEEQDERGMDPTIHRNNPPVS
ncbi:hypothetical protein SDC9_200946 [bioreactor metagenome]|uniref:Uncharacterized protein n=1 Tax=bioreactor metagenome TaxID=1076179 RepID=A0A645IQW5_9ZZZZ